MAISSLTGRRVFARSALQKHALRLQKCGLGQAWPGYEVWEMYDIPKVRRRRVHEMIASRQPEVLLPPLRASKDTPITALGRANVDLLAHPV